MRTFFGPMVHRSTAVNLRIFATLMLLTLAVSLGAQTTARAAPKYAGIVIDAKTGKVLYSRNADARRYPASLTKMMTLYLVFEDLKRGRVTLKSKIRMSRKAAGEPPSKLGIKAGRSFTVKQAIYALVTKSANDVSTAIGEKLSGSEAAFARRMTAKARQLGMNRTIFRNAHGLPDRRQVTTARDMAKLGLALREHFPRKFQYFKARSFKYGRRRYRNHNRLLGRVKGVDGIKTGYTRASGFNLVSSVSRGKRRIVAVVMGGKTGRSRNAQMTRLISKYLPRASRGRAKILIAKARQIKKTSVKKTVSPTAVITASVITPKARPKTASGPPRSGRIDNAFKASNGGTYATGTDDIRAKLIKLAASQIPLPSPSPTAIDTIRTGSVSKSNAGKTRNRYTGWQIQIGAMPNRQSAIILLQKARKKAKTVLASTSNYMEPVAKGNTTLIRARFAGFRSKDSAWRACRYLQKRKFACLAIMQ